MSFLKRNTVSPKQIKASAGSARNANKASSKGLSKKTGPEPNFPNYPMLQLQMSTI
ncbi:hypothetical protein VKS41_007044 [Umbelopsis sp. WA50703]